jgi:hypothetical protein
VRAGCAKIILPRILIMQLMAFISSIAFAVETYVAFPGGYSVKYTQLLIKPTKSSSEYVSNPPPASRRPALVAPTLIENNKFERFSKFDVSVGANYLSLVGLQTSNQSTGRLLSGLSPSVDISWSQYWSSSFSSEIYFGVEQVQFEDDPNGTSLAKTGFLSSFFGAGLNYKFTGYLVGGLNLGMAQTFFYTGLNSGQLAINQVPILRLNPKLQWDLLKLQPFTISVLGGVSYYGPSSYGNYDIQPGYGYNGAIQISQEFRQTTLKCKVGYSERDQNTTYLNLVEKDVGVDCGLSWSL